MINPYKHLLTKMKYLVNEDKRVGDTEKSDYQWSMIFTRGQIKFIIGKGGVNTIFYIIGDKREVCFPEEGLKLLEKKSLDKYLAYAVFSKEKELVYGPMLFQEDALALKAEKNQYLIGFKTNGRLVPLFQSKKNLFNKYSWHPVTLPKE